MSRGPVGPGSCVRAHKSLAGEAVWSLGIPSAVCVLGSHVRGGKPFCLSPKGTGRRWTGLPSFRSWGPEAAASQVPMGHPPGCGVPGQGASTPVITSRFLGPLPACYFQPLAVINNPARVFVHESSFALWVVSLKCVPRSPVTGSGAMERLCASRDSSPSPLPGSPALVSTATGTGQGCPLPSPTSLLF